MSIKAEADDYARKLDDVKLRVQWEQAKDTAEQSAIYERAMRDELVRRFFGECKDGTHYHELGSGWKLKAVLGTVYSATEKDNHKITAAVNEVARLEPEKAFKLVSWKPSFSGATIRSLNDEATLIMSKVCISKPAAPQLELVPPKGE